MTHSIHKSFGKVSYPCYFLPQKGEFWQNEAAAQPTAPDARAVESTLTVLAREYAKDPAALPPTMPLLDDALRIQSLSVLPMEEGLLAFYPPPQEAPISAFSAELRDPLSAIFAMLPILASKLDDEDQYLTENMQSRSYQLLRLANNLENIALTQRSLATCQMVDMASLVSSVCASVAEHRRGYPVGITWDVPDIVLPVSCDAHLVTEALLNLLRNSLQYTRDENHVHVKLAVAGKRVLLTVEDKGLGIKPEFLERVFSPYFSIDPYGDSDQRTGLGLGLTIARETARRFGGTAAVQSSFGEGTTVSLSFPLSDEEGTVLDSDPGNYRRNNYSSVFIQLHGLCWPPLLNAL